MREERPKKVNGPPLVIDDSGNVPNFEPYLFLMGFGLLVLFLLVGAK